VPRQLHIPRKPTEGLSGAQAVFQRLEKLLLWGFGETEQVGEDAVGSGNTLGQLAV
jgi:hypothetical protein